MSPANVGIKNDATRLAAAVPPDTKALCEGLSCIRIGRTYSEWLGTLVADARMPGGQLHGDAACPKGNSEETPPERRYRWVYCRKSIRLVAASPVSLYSGTMSTHHKMNLCALLYADSKRASEGHLVEALWDLTIDNLARKRSGSQFVRHGARSVKNTVLTNSEAVRAAGATIRLDDRRHAVPSLQLHVRRRAW